MFAAPTSAAGSYSKSGDSARLQRYHPRRPGGREEVAGQRLLHLVGRGPLLGGVVIDRQYEDDRQAIVEALVDRGARRRRSGDELWYDHHCLFHDDARSSASFQPETGVYYCRTEDERYTVPDVLKVLGLPVGEPISQARRRAGSLIRRPTRSREAEPTSRRRRAPAPSRNGHHPTPEFTYAYRFPDGRVSHLKHRVGHGDDKLIWQEGPNGEARLPDELWPIYGDAGVEPGSALLVVEGEKAVDRLTAAGDRFRQAPITALTAGSANDLRRHAQALADRIQELEPAAVLVWADNDEPGKKAMDAVCAELRDLGVRHQRVRPRRLKLAEKAGADDYLEAGGSLADIFAQYFEAGGSGTLAALVTRTVVTSSLSFVFPGTRRLASIKPEMTKALWIHETGVMPTAAQSEELAARLRHKALTQPAKVVYRLATADGAFWWRPHADGPAWRIDTAKTPTLDDDPQDTVIALPGENPVFSIDVEVDGKRSDLVELCSAFHLNETEIAMIEGWLVSLLCGLQTPIMLMRGPAATGKSTLARLIMGIVEPLVPHLDVRERSTDERALVRALERSPGLVLDNVSRMSSETEDMLSKLVTGMTTPIRTLYEDSIEMLRMSRGIIITTTNWDVYKGDLATRIVVVQPSTDSATAWRSERALNEELGALIPYVRGYIFKRCARFYRQRHKHMDRQLPFRVGDLGVVFAALGYDVDDLATKEAAAKADVIATNDPWVEALVAMWKEADAVSFVKTTVDICDWLDDYGCEDVPAPRSPKLARWLGEKAPIFRDHGFSYEPVRTADWRGYRFYRARPGQAETYTAGEPSDGNAQG